MYDVFYNIFQSSLKDLQLRYMDTDSFELHFIEGNVDNDHIDLSNPEPPIKTNNNVPGKFKQELGSRTVEEFRALSPKTYSFKDYSNKTKEKGIKNCNNAKNEEYYNALMYNPQRTVDECRIQKFCDNMTTTKRSMIGLNTFDDKIFYVNNIKSYHHDENLYLFKKDLVNKIKASSLDLGKAQLANNILELTIIVDRKSIKAAIRLYNDLCI